MARARFADIGGQNVPAIANAGACIPGADLDRVAEFLNLAVEHRDPLPVDDLIERLRHVLATATRLTRQIPAEDLSRKLPNRDRTVLALANHIVEIAAGYLLVENGHPFDAKIAGAIPSRELDPGDLTTRSTSVRDRLAALRRQPECEVETLHGTTQATTRVARATTRVVRATTRVVRATTRVAPTGTSDRHRVLERCTWHAAQHTRQLAFMLERLGVEPDRPLTGSDLEGLPLPAAVWDDEPA